LGQTVLPCGAGCKKFLRIVPFGLATPAASGRSRLVTKPRRFARNDGDDNALQVPATPEANGAVIAALDDVPGDAGQ
jgi:hypothetical protein